MPAFSKAVGVRGQRPCGLSRLRQTQEGRKGFLRKAFRRGLRFRSGRSWARATGTQDPSSGGAGARWAPFSADRAGRRDFLGGPTARRGLPQARLPCPRKRVPPFGTSGREGQPHRRLKSPAARCTRLGGISGGIGDNLPPSGTALRKPPARVFLEKHPTGMFFVSFLRLLTLKGRETLSRALQAFEKA